MSDRKWTWGTSTSRARGSWYAVTVIDYDWRDLVALRFTWRYSATEVVAS